MQKGDKRREEILGVSAELFARKGYRNTTLQDILDGVQCSKGSFYHHFDSKLQVLEAIALRRTKADYAKYRTKPHDSALEALNDLLAFSCPFRRGEESLVAALVGLGIRQEGAAVSANLNQARRATFFGGLKALLNTLREEGLAYYYNDALPELLWESHMAFCGALMRECCRLIISGGTPGSRVLEMLRAARFQWERLLDLPFSSISIVPVDELLFVLKGASSMVQAEDEQLRFDSAPPR